MRKIKIRNFWTAAQTITKPLLAVFLFIGGIILNMGNYHLNDDAQLNQKIICNLGALVMLGWFVNILSSMFFTRSETEKLAENIFNRLYSIVNQQIIRSRGDGVKLTTNEQIIISQINDVIYTLEEFYDIDEYRDELFGRYKELLIRDYGVDFVAKNFTPPSTFQNAETQIVYDTLHSWKDSAIIAASGSQPPPQS